MTDQIKHTERRVPRLFEGEEFPQKLRDLVDGKIPSPEAQEASLKEIEGAAKEQEDGK